MGQKRHKSLVRFFLAIFESKCQFTNLLKFRKKIREPTSKPLKAQWVPVYVKRRMSILSDNEALENIKEKSRHMQHVCKELELV